MKLGEKIVATEKRIGDIRDEIAALVAKAESESRDLTDDESTMIETLSDEQDGLEKSLKGLKRAEKALGDRAEARNGGGAAAPATSVPMTHARAAAPQKPGELLIKSAVIHTLAHITKRNPQDLLTERYSHDQRVKAVFDRMKSGVPTAVTTGSGWAAELVETDLAGFLAELEPVSVYGALAAAGVSIPFGDANAVTVPRRSGSGNVSGAFVGENATIPVKRDTYAGTTFNRHKAAVISTFSQELARVSTPQIEGLLRSAIVSDTGDMLDSVLLGVTNASVPGIRPASPFFGSSNQASAGDTLADILTDLKFLIGVHSAANAGRNPRLVMNPARANSLKLLTNTTGAFVFRDELANGRLMGIQVIESTNCPADTVFIVDAADFATAFGTPEFDVSDQATLVMLNDDGTDPTMADTNAVSVAGSVQISDAAGVTGGPATVASMFQQWAVALRMVMPVTWGMVRPGVTGYLTGVSW